MISIDRICAAHGVSLATCRDDAALASSRALPSSATDNENRALAWVYVTEQVTP
jgi:hypothetical protein